MHPSADRRCRPLSFVLTPGQAADTPQDEGAPGVDGVNHDTALHHDRNAVDRRINKIKEWQGLTTHYDSTPASHLAGLHLRRMAIGLRSLH